MDNFTFDFKSKVFTLGDFHFNIFTSVGLTVSSVGCTMLVGLVLHILSHNNKPDYYDFKDREMLGEMAGGFIIVALGLFYWSEVIRIFVLWYNRSPKPVGENGKTMEHATMRKTAKYSSYLSHVLLLLGTASCVGGLSSFALFLHLNSESSRHEIISSSFGSVLTVSGFMLVALPRLIQNWDSLVDMLTTVRTNYQYYYRENDISNAAYWTAEDDEVTFHDLPSCYFIRRNQRRITPPYSTIPRVFMMDKF